MWLWSSKHVCRPGGSVLPGPAVFVGFHAGILPAHWAWSLWESPECLMLWLFSALGCEMCFVPGRERTFFPETRGGPKGNQALMRTESFSGLTSYFYPSGIYFWLTDCWLWSAMWI